MKPRTRTVQRRPKQWTLARLFRQCRAAPVVWLALSDLADETGANVVTPTRAQLATMTDIARVKTISAALTALRKAFWLEIEHVPVVENRKQVGTVLKIKLFHRRGENRPIGKGAGRIAKSLHREGEKRPIATGRKTPQDFPTGRGAPARPLPLPGGASGSPTPAKDTGGTSILDGASNGQKVRPITEWLKIGATR